MGDDDDDDDDDNNNNLFSSIGLHSNMGFVSEKKGSVQK
jgi:hypothetical protein